MYARALIDRADREHSANPAAALWMARRAREVSPDLELAKERDHTWSRNRFTVPAYGLVIAGVASVAAGFVFAKLSTDARNELTDSVHDTARVDELVSAQRTYGLSALSAFGSGPAAIFAGLLLRSAGTPPKEPTSPEYLPAFDKEGSP